MSNLLEPRNAAEARLLGSSVSGEVADFRSETDRQIRSGFLRAILLRQLEGSVANLRVVNAIVDDVDGLGLDLADFAPLGQKLVALSLEHCVFRGKLLFRSARMARLSLRGSRFPELCLRDAEIDGPLDIADVAAPDDGGKCWIDGRNCPNQRRDRCVRCPAAGAAAAGHETQATRASIMHSCCAMPRSRAALSWRPDFRPEEASPYHWHACMAWSRRAAPR